MLRDPLAISNIVMNRPTVEARLAILGASGNFTDGIISYKGNWLDCKNLCFIR
ncbi:hypothetical protein ABID39_000223 [Bartonella japonica]|uniref:Uncharacterized protein n=1 Tax=Bartonella japonica TaxID=357761 RepID=A0ABV2FLU2_9HYPH